jgi:hypothetical protein
MGFWPVKDITELDLYSLYLHFTYPQHVIAYPQGYLYHRLNTTALEYWNWIILNPNWRSQKIAVFADTQELMV